MNSGLTPVKLNCDATLSPMPTPSPMKRALTIAPRRWGCLLKSVVSSNQGTRVSSSRRTNWVNCRYNLPFFPNRPGAVICCTVPPMTPGNWPGGRAGSTNSAMNRSPTCRSGWPFSRRSPGERPSCCSTWRTRSTTVEPLTSSGPAGMPGASSALRGTGRVSAARACCAIQAPARVRNPRRARLGRVMADFPLWFARGANCR